MVYWLRMVGCGVVVVAVLGREGCDKKLGMKKNGRKTRIGTQISTFIVSLILGPTTLAMKSETSAAVRGCFLVQVSEVRERAVSPPSLL